MTTIAFRNGILAADSCETFENDDAAYGTSQNSCNKLFRVGPFVVALQGDSTPGMLWLRWFENSGDYFNQDGDVYSGPPVNLARVPENLTERFLAQDADFTAVVLDEDGDLFEYDKWGIPVPVTSEYYACGSGAKAALGAMHAGASAENAVLAACAHDPYTKLPVKTSENI